MSDIDTSELRALLAAATPGGEWQAVEGDLEGKPVSEYARTLFANREKDGTTTSRLFLTVAPNPIDPEKGATVVPALTGDGPQARANAHLIAAAINTLPALLDAADERDAAIRRARADAWDEGYDAGYEQPNPYREAPQDWRPLPENVHMHTMMAFHDHGDGRFCQYHARLARWTFDDDRECLRADHPEPFRRREVTP